MHKLVSRALVLVSSTVLFGVLSSYGQNNDVKKPVTHVAMAQTNDWLKSNPSLSSGFKTKKDATVKIEKATRGGYVATVTDSDGFRGKVTVVGPPTVLEKDWLGDLIDLAIEVGKKILSGSSGGGGGAGGGGGNSSNNSNNGCVNVNVNNTGSGAGSGQVIIVVGTGACSPA